MNKQELETTKQVMEAQIRKAREYEIKIGLGNKDIYVAQKYKESLQLIGLCMVKLNKAGVHS